MSLEHRALYISRANPSAPQPPENQGRWLIPNKRSSIFRRVSLTVEYSEEQALQVVAQGDLLVLMLYWLCQTPRKHRRCSFECPSGIQYSWGRAAVCRFKNYTGAVGTLVFSLEHELCLGKPNNPVIPTLATVPRGSFLRIAYAVPLVFANVFVLQIYKHLSREEPAGIPMAHSILKKSR